MVFERFSRFRRGEDVDGGAGDGPATAVAERERVISTNRGFDSALERRVARREAVIERREIQEERFGGFSWGAAFFGWLVAVGMGAILTATAGAAGAVLRPAVDDANPSAETIGIAGAAILLGIIAAAYYAGGYVAGRMARFEGARQGFGVWAFALVAAIVLAALGAVAGSEYNVLGRLDLPRIPIEEGALTTGGAIALAAALVVSLVAAVLGAVAGRRFHRRVDEAEPA